MPEPILDQLYTTRARVTGVQSFDAIRAQAESDDSAAALLDLARSRALNPESFDRYPPVFFTVDASTNVVDSYSTIMGDSTLANFAADAGEGRAVLDSHRSSETGFGKSLTGQVVATKVNGESAKAVRSSFFTISGYRHRDIDTDSLIAGIETGMHSDISVGFFIPPGEGLMRCSICGENMLDWDSCSHFAGLSYDVDTNKGTEKRVAIGTIENARLSEYSLVYDGATPGAAVVKAIRMIEAGEVDPATVDRLGRAYHREFKLNRSWSAATRGGTSGVSVKREKDASMELLDQLIELADKRGVRVRAGADATGVLSAIEKHFDALETDRSTAETDRDTAIENARKLQQQIDTDAKLVEDGRAYRASVVDAAIEAEIRTLPEDAAKNYNKETHRRYFESMEIDDVKELTRTFEARSIFEPNRESSEHGTPTAPARQPRRVPGMKLHKDQ